MKRITLLLCLVLVGLTSGAYFKNTASHLTVYAWDTKNNVPKTGNAANLTAFVRIDGGTLTALTDTSATEIDDVNAPGAYEFDVTQGELNGSVCVFTCKSGTASIYIAPITIATTEPINLDTATGSLSDSQIDDDAIGTIPDINDIENAIAGTDVTVGAFNLAFPADIGDVFTGLDDANSIATTMFTYGAGTYATADANSVVKQIADNAGGASISLDDITAAVWDANTADYNNVGSMGLANATAGGSSFDPNTTPVQLSTTALAAIVAEFPFDPNGLIQSVVTDVSGDAAVATTDDLDSTITANASVVAMKATTDKLDDLVEDSGGGAYILTVAALANAPSGGLDAAGIRAALGMDANDLDVQLATLSTLGVADIRTALGVSTANIDSQLSGIASSASDAKTAAEKIDTANELRTLLTGGTTALITTADIPTDFGTVTVADGKIAADASVSLTEEDIAAIAESVSIVWSDMLDVVEPISGLTVGELLSRLNVIAK